jgi:carotenoid cleavage dioxygenase-like enzyme
MPYLHKELPDIQAAKDSIFYAGFLKLDMKAEKVTKSVSFGETKTAGEVFFQKRDGATEEDDGYVMTFVYDWQSKQSSFMMWDARSLEIVVDAPLRDRVPHGFHGLFV